MKELGAIFDDTKEARLQGDDMFNVEEVEEMLGGLLERVESNVRDDLQLTVSMSVLAIRQLFEDADEQARRLDQCRTPTLMISKIFPKRCAKS